jgi:acyl-CoA thioesterase
MTGALDQNFDDASRVTRVGAENVFDIEIPEGWLQGRGAFGGLVLGTLLRASDASEPDRARRTRSLLGDIAAPVVAGKAKVHVTVLRRGNNQSNIRADLEQNGTTVAFASAVLSTPRSVGIPDHRPRIEIPSREGAIVIPADAPLKPPFLRHFDLTVKSGIPFAGAPPVVEAWIRLTEPPAAVDGPLLIAYLDSYWPCVWTFVTSPRPTATISFTAQLLRDPSAIDPKEPLFYRAETQCDDEGFELEYRYLYDSSGALVAANQQTFCVIK